MADSQRRRVPDASRSGRDNIVAWQAGVIVALLATWEGLGRIGGGDQVSSPSRIIGRIATWLGGELYPHLFITLAELTCGMAIGSCLGILAGLILGRMPVVSIILRPIIVGLYSVPLVTLAPLFFMFFGLGVMPKIVLVSIVTALPAVLQYVHAQQVDEDHLALDPMGATKGEQFRAGSRPPRRSDRRRHQDRCLICAGRDGHGRIARHRAGLGFHQPGRERFDMTSLYAVLLILMALGLLLSEAALRLEHRFLRWRQVAE